MRSPINAASDVMNELNMYQTVRETVSQDNENPGRWLITFESVPSSLIRSRLHVEVLEEGAVACVLERENVGHAAMVRIMNRLMDRLERPRSLRPSRQSPSGGSPPSSPA